MNEADEHRADSPCIGVCIIDETSGLCEGCLRTLEEVAVWGCSTDRQRRAILDAVARRRASTHVCPPS